MNFPAALLFDMDGTLTCPMLDFPLIKAEMGIGERPILEALGEMYEDARRAAEVILHRHEDAAAENSTLNAGCAELLDFIEKKGVPIAIITRNSRRSAQTVLARHGLMIDTLVTRDDGMFKPSPQPIIEACQRLSVRVAHTWMIGDGEYDVEAGNAAGARTVWISHGEEQWFEAQPWKTVSDLRELHAVLRNL